MGSKLFDDWGVGVHYDMPEDVYRAIPAINNTALKHARRSFRHFEYYMGGGEYEETSAMVFGRISHRALLEYERFKAECVFSDFKDKKAKGYAAAVKANKDKYVLTVKEHRQLSDMFTELSRNKTCMDLIADGRAEVTLLAIDPITQMRLKCRVDFISSAKPFMLDYKTTEDAKPTEFIPALEGGDKKPLRSSKFEVNAAQLGYHRQAAFYLMIGQLLGLNVKYFSVLAQEKRPPYVPCPYVYGPETLDSATTANRKQLNRIKDQLQLEAFPGYAEGAVVLSLPPWEWEE